MKRTLAFFVIGAQLLLGQHAGEQKENPVQLYRGMGLHTHPIAAPAEAQKYFNQGLVLLYGFNRYEALRSFRKAAELAPQAIMPQVGIAWTSTPHINMDLGDPADLKAGCEAGKKAMTLQGPEQEQAYAKAAAGMCDGDEGYRRALRALHEKYPYDMDAATLYAESLMVPVRWQWWKNGRPNGEMGTCIQILESVLKRDPDHPGANHFYVHAMEMSPNPEYALPSAQRLMGGIAPGAGHLVHMAGHIYLRVGDYEIVAASNERAAQVDEDYFHHSNVHGSYVGYYAHNLSFIVTGRAMQGRYAESIAAAKKMVGTMEPMVAAMPEMVDTYLPFPVFVQLRFRKWDEILATPAVTNAKLPVSKAMQHFARAQALQAKGRKDEAAKEAAMFEVARKVIPAETIWGNNKASQVMALASEQLAARLSATPQEAVEHWMRAVAVQDALIYDEPPAWYYPLRESLGAALLLGGRAADAERVFREDLEMTPRNGRSLFGLWQALEMQGRKADAASVKAEFEKAWKRAQVALRLEEL